MTKKHVLTLRVGGTNIRATADHPFYVFGRGWTQAAELALEISYGPMTGGLQALKRSATARSAVVCELDVTVPPFPCRPMARGHFGGNA